MEVGPGSEDRTEWVRVEMGSGVSQLRGGCVSETELGTPEAQPHLGQRSG